MRPFEQQVRERAYYIWEGEGRVFGHAEAHWLRAEAELRADRVGAPAAAVQAPLPAEVLKPKANRARSAAVKSAVTKAVAAETGKAKAKAAPKLAAPKAARPKAPRATAASSAALH